MPKLKVRNGEARPAGVKKVDRSSKNSIVIRTEHVPIRDLQPYYKNARKGDIEKVAESLHENGQFKPIVVNVGSETGRKNEILAGNHTYLAARKLGWREILVSWVDLGETEARAVVLADNAAGDNSTYDEALLTELLQEHKEDVGSLVGTTYADSVLDSLVKKMDEDPNANVDTIADADDQMEGVADLNNDILFQGSDSFEIPILREDMLLDKLPDKLDVWAGHELDLPRQEAEPDRWWLTQWNAGCRGVNWKQAIPYFYAPDFHFTSIYEDTATATKKILNLGITASVMPNYSIIFDHPSATWIWALYRSFYVARFFQEAGIKIVPDVRVAVEEDVVGIWANSVPQGAPVVACQIQNANKDDDYIRRAARTIRMAEELVGFENILVYGYNDADEVMKRAKLKAQVTRVLNRSARRREYLNSGATVNTQQVRKKAKKPSK